MVALLLVVAAVGCANRPTRPAAGPITVPVPPGPADPACAPVLAALPTVLGPGLVRRPVVDGGSRAAAWGDPPVTLLCGTATADPNAQQVQVGPPAGPLLSFAIGHDGAATTFTAVGLRIPVLVRVPEDADSTVLVPLVTALTTGDPPA